jgi:Type IV secretion system pilin
MFLAIITTLALGVAVLGGDVSSAAAIDQIKSGVSQAGGGGAPSLTSIIKTVINVLLFAIGVAAVIVIVISGFRFVTSNGDSNTITSAKNTILYAVIGIVVAFSAYAIINFVLGQLSPPPPTE